MVLDIFTRQKTGIQSFDVEELSGARKGQLKKIKIPRLETSRQRAARIARISVKKGARLGKAIAIGSVTPIKRVGKRFIKKRGRKVRGVKIRVINIRSKKPNIGGFF